MRRVWGHLAALVVMSSALIVGPMSPACACSCAEPDPVKNAAWADLVFVGVVVDVDRPAFSMSSGDLMTARLTVERVDKGSAAGHVEIKTAVEGPSCGFGFVEGTRYLIYSRDGQTSICAGNRMLGAAPEVELDSDVPVAALVAGAATVVVVALALWWVLRRRGTPRPVAGPVDDGPAGAPGQDSA
ncbi:hypothetical protein [Catellatospora bangladeshensis]|uniref:hypothetical protein n=1 Tax=Catellatospora bangladeshensis TaxID=310355 RepID=UPI0019424DA0|nr:hypothetical protein [Catellatospora bangladeshensis]